MNVLYISTQLSPKFIKELYATGYKPIQSAQKFNNLIATGLKKNGASVTALSNIPLKNLKGVVYKRNTEIESGVWYSYIPKINIKVIENVAASIFSFFKTLKWGFKNRKKDTTAIFDILNVSVCSGALLACKTIGVKTVGIVTDVPGIRMQKNKKRSLKERLSEFILGKYMINFDQYVLLTEQMNEVVNPKNKPYMVMEGLVDINMTRPPIQPNRKDKKIVLYAGGLYEQYGIKRTIDAFMKLKGENNELHLYGPGDMVKDMDKYQKADKRIKYLGIVHNSVVVDAQLKATILINPRPTEGEYTKYSFPSKNMEYMVSGTPVLTTNLPGMPVEYHEYVYLLDDESVEGIHSKLDYLLNQLSPDALKEKGCKAREFVLVEKNNVHQAERIMGLIKKNS